MLNCHIICPTCPLETFCLFLLCNSRIFVGPVGFSGDAISPSSILWNRWQIQINIGCPLKGTYLENKFKINITHWYSPEKSIYHAMFVATLDTKTLRGFTYTVTGLFLAGTFEETSLSSWELSSLRMLAIETAEFSSSRGNASSSFSELADIRRLTSLLSIQLWVNLSFYT